MTTDSPQWTDVAGKAFEDAKRLHKEGDYAGALERHEWFHENALAYKSGYYGVRLSYALGCWKELADVYPPAMTSLIGIRNRGTQSLLDGTGSPQLLHDVASINDALNQTDATIELFRQLEFAHPELAKQSFSYIDRLCLRLEPFLFRRHCSNPVGFFRQQRESYFRTAMFMIEREDKDTEVIDEMRAELREFATRIMDVFSDDRDVVSKVALLESTADEELARRLE